MMPITASPVGAADGTRFGDALLQLIGEPFLFLRRSYGDEIVLHFGTPSEGPTRPITGGRSFRYEHGSCRVHLRASAWVLKAKDASRIFSNGLAEEIARSLGSPLRRVDVAAESPLTPGNRIVSALPFRVDRAGVTGFGLRLDLSDGAALVALPTPDEDDPLAGIPADAAVFEVADWEIVTPAGRLTVGPTTKWNWTPASPPSPH